MTANKKVPNSAKAYTVPPATSTGESPVKAAPMNTNTLMNGTMAGRLFAVPSRRFARR